MRDKTEPFRQCLGCKQVRPRQELLRLTRSSDGTAHYDHASTRGGRGGYVCPRPLCFQRAFKGRHPRFSLAASDMEALIAEIRTALCDEIARSLRRAEKMGYMHDGPGRNTGDLVLRGAEHGLGGDATRVVTGGYPMMAALERDLTLLERLSSEGL